jgi:hypothetical protein
VRMNAQALGGLTNVEPALKHQAGQMGLLQWSGASSVEERCCCAAGHRRERPGPKAPFPYTHLFVNLTLRQVRSDGSA